MKPTLRLSKPYKQQVWVFDVDGTLLDMPGHSWDKIDGILGTIDYNKELTNLYRAGRISYITWCDLNLQLYKSLGLTQKIFTRIFASVQPTQGATETLTALKRAGVKLSIVSGGFLNLLKDRVPLNLFADKYINRLHFNDSGELERWALTRYGDGQGKAQALNALREKYIHSNPVFIIYVGDNQNDLEAFKSADIAVAFNPKTSRVSATADLVIRNDMRQILKCLS